MSSETYGLSRGIVGTLQDGRTLAKGETSEILRWAATIQPPWYVQVNIPNLNIIDAILDINIKNISPKACFYGICDKTISRHPTGGYPVVGFTIVGCTNIAAGLTATGVTVTCEIVCVGW